ncbi:ECF-type sigma factor [Aeoliella sp. ICT_H6.2]|uniref:ECF-type sigma factor n=1 Tax=Aeoliella straminimaris TaxID=2954799 RepID=A0A9X2FJA7_9BACT|nr:ECF-type sigma factor [Aeoliella straminimaris]MCO6046906.1 ECF-type sigma factor [Aeoliella straminimaris]
MADVTQILSQIEQGDPTAGDQLLPLVYDELRKLAAAKLNGEKSSPTMQATALVHDAYVRLVNVETAQHWESRGHFFAAAAEAMRRILIERARKRSRRDAIRGQQVSLDQLASPESFSNAQLLLMDEALGKLEANNPEAAAIVKLRFFAGLSMDQSAEALGIPKRTAERKWTYARTWLHREMEKFATDDGPGGS